MGFQTAETVLWSLVLLHIIYLAAGENGTVAQEVGEPCTPGSCGQNTNCRKIDGMTICSCLSGYVGDSSFSGDCTKPNCVSSDDCIDSLACLNGTCLSPCPGPCVRNAHCQGIKHSPECTCLPGYTGNPYNSCKRFERDGSQQDRKETCPPGSCGRNTKCRMIAGISVCSCLIGYIEDSSFSGDCTRVECFSSDECFSSLACFNGKCLDPCPGLCGVNAACHVIRHSSECTCLPGYTGNPFRSCEKFDVPELCQPSPCGPNSICEGIGEVITCKCEPGFQGSPPDCSPECDIDSECPVNRACIDFRCQNPCLSQCGERADCKIRNHQAVCTCPENYIGNPMVSCKLECYRDKDCSSDRPECFYGKCINRCDGVCGIGEECNLNGLTPECSCPNDITRNTSVECKPFTAQDLCELYPCGANADCQPTFETRKTTKRPVCSCQIGFIGSPETGCQKGECYFDSDCPNDKACIKYICKNPCDDQCGVNAKCNSRNHIAVCTCPTGYAGNATSQCYASKERVVDSLFGKNNKRKKNEGSKESEGTSEMPVSTSGELRSCRTSKSIALLFFLGSFLISLI